MYYSILCKCYILISVLGVCGQVFGQINPFIKRHQPPNIGAYHKQQNAMFSERPQIISDSFALRDSHKNTHETRAPFRGLAPQPRQQQVFYDQKKQMPYQGSVSRLRPTTSQQQITPHRRHIQQFHKNTAEIRQFQTYSSPNVDVIQKPLRNYRLPENSERTKQFNKRTYLSNTEGNDYEEEEPQFNDNVLEKPQRVRNFQTLTTNVREEEPQELQPIDHLPKHLKNMQQFRAHPEDRHEIERQNIGPIPQEMRRYQTMAPPRLGMEDSEDDIYKPKNREEISVNRFESHSTNVDHEETDRMYPNNNRRKWHRTQAHPPIEEEEFGPEPEEPVNRMPKNQVDLRRYPTRPPESKPNVYIPNKNTFQNFHKVNELQNRNHIQHQFSQPEPKIERKIEMQKYYPIQNLNNENRVDKNSGENIQNYPHHNVQHTIERQHNIPHQSISLRPMPLIFQRDRDQQEFPFQKNHIIKQSHHFDPFQRIAPQKQRQQMPNENIQQFKGPFKKEVALIREITEILPSNDENFDRPSIDKPSPPDMPAIYSPFDRKDELNERNERNERNEENEENERNDKTVELLRDENFYDDDEDVPKTKASESSNRDKDNDRLKSKFEREVDISADDLEKYFDREFANENEKDEEAQKKIDFEDTNESNQQLSKKEKNDDSEADEPELEYKTSDDFLKNHDDFLNKIEKENDKFRKETDNKETDNKENDDNDNDNDNESEEDNKKTVDDGEKELDESDKKEDEEEETTDTKQSKQKTNKDDSSSDGDEKSDSTSNEESKEKTKNEAEDDETESESKKVTEKETEKKSNNKEDQENDEKQENESKDEEENDKQKSDKTKNDENDEKCAENKCETELLKEEESKELKTREELEKSLEDDKRLSQESKDDLISKSDRKETKSLTTTEANPTIVRVNNRLNRVSKTETHSFSPYFIDLKRINTKKTNTLNAEKQNNLGNDTNSQRIMTTSATTSPRRKSLKRKNSSKSKFNAIK